MKDKLKGKRALVTAGGQGIGLEVVKGLLGCGCDVCLHYFTSAVDEASLLEEAGAPAGTRLESFQADLCAEDAAQALVACCEERLGGLDILVNNAGSLVGRCRLDEVEPEFYHEVMDLNLASMVWVTRAALPPLRRAGGASVVNIASLAGRKGGHGGSLFYATAKGAVLTFTRALSTELAGDGIRVNAVAPGLILGTRFHATHTTEAAAMETIRGIPLGRAGTIADVARAVLFLASEYDGFITGATLDINGGVYCA